jgi:hypothetical protein
MLSYIVSSRPASDHIARNCLVREKKKKKVREGGQISIMIAIMIN